MENYLYLLMYAHKMTPTILMVVDLVAIHVVLVIYMSFNIDITQFTIKIHKSITTTKEF